MHFSWLDTGIIGADYNNNSSPCRIYASVTWVSIASGNGLSPDPHQAITWTNAGLFSIGLLGPDFSEIRIGILIQENAFGIVICQNGGHFVQGEMS